MVELIPLVPVADLTGPPGEDGQDALGTAPQQQVLADWVRAVGGPNAFSESLLEVVTTQIADEPEVIDAAAAKALAGVNLGVTLLEQTSGGTPDPLIGLTTVRGTPTFETPAKQGTGSLRGGSVLRTPLSLPTGAKATVEAFVQVPAAPSGSGDGAIRILLFFADVDNSAAVHYLAVNADGTVRVISGGNNTNNKAAGPNIIHATTWHHVAVVLDNNGSRRKVEAAYVDGVALDGSLWSNTATALINTLYLGGIHTATSFDSLSSWHTDSVRISTGARYTANFTPPETLTADGTTQAFFSMDPAAPGGLVYPARPSVPGGMVTYIGTTEPTSWLTDDRWFVK